MDDPERALYNKRPQWAVPEEFIFMQPAFAQCAPLLPWPQAAWPDLYPAFWTCSGEGRTVHWHCHGIQSLGMLGLYAEVHFAEG